MAHEADAALMMQLGCDGGTHIQTGSGEFLLNLVSQCSSVQEFSW